MVHLVHASTYTGCFDIRIRIPKPFFFYMFQCTTQASMFIGPQCPLLTWFKPIAHKWALDQQSLSASASYLDQQELNAEIALVWAPTPKRDSHFWMVPNLVFPSSRRRYWDGKFIRFRPKQLLWGAFPLTFAILACISSANALSSYAWRM